MSSSYTRNRRQGRASASPARAAVAFLGAIVTVTALLVKVWPF